VSASLSLRIVMTSTDNGAGPSTHAIIPTRRKHQGPHPTSTKSQTRKKLPPPLPSRPTSTSHPHGSHSLPIRPLQGIRTKRTDTTKPGFGRETVFVTRRTPLGGLIGRCRGMILEEGYVPLFSLFGIEVADGMGMDIMDIGIHR
jgi:hypothetical protein